MAHYQIIRQGISRVITITWVIGVNWGRRSLAPDSGGAGVSEGRELLQGVIYGAVLLFEWIQGRLKPALPTNRLAGACSGAL